MENIPVELSNAYYDSEIVDGKVVITNRFYKRNGFVFLLYILLEFFGGPSFECNQIPRKFVITGETSYVRLSKKLELETDGTVEIIFSKKNIRRWFFGVVIPFFSMLILFVILFYQTIGFLIVSNLSFSSIILFVAMLTMVAIFGQINLALLKQYRQYKSYDSEYKVSN
ncbi:hypothetical protein [Amphibacillus indicireducens]|uniref:DUF443 family protein n=1 Tax=Amphibacillus indicireducens TaxID=1076330 RepID=A0ABP7VSP6_9BACI